MTLTALKSFVRAYWGAIGLTLFIAIGGSLRYHGAYLIFLTMLLAPGVLYVAFVLAFRPARRKVVGLKTLAFLSAFGIAWMSQSLHHHAIRADANELVAQAQAYKDRTGQFPESMNAMGLRTRGGFEPYYVLAEGVPSVIHYSTVLPVDRFEYRFDEKRWVLVSR